MMNPEARTYVGQNFEDQFILVREGDEYLGCKFLRCRVVLPKGSSKFYDCELMDCEIVMPKETQ